MTTTEIFKCYKNSTFFDAQNAANRISKLLDFNSRFLLILFRHNDKLTLKMRYARTYVFKYSFFNRVVKTWNSLPLSIREATSVNIYKALVRKFLMD